MTNQCKQFEHTHPYTARNVSWLLDARANSHGDKMFIAHEPVDQPSDQWTFLEFRNIVRIVASRLTDNGVRNGDFVVIHMENCPEFLFSWFACVHIGAVPVTTNTRSSIDELSYFIEHSNAKFAITQQHLGDIVCRCSPSLTWVAITAMAETDDQTKSEPLRLNFQALMSGKDNCGPSTISDRAICSVQYTSGTTSRPKGVVWTHANALWGANVNADHMRLTEKDTSLVYLPLFHTNALCYSVLASLWAAAAIVILPKFSARRFWPLSLKYQCTWASTIPAIGTALSKLPGPEFQHRYRFWGSPVCNDPDTRQRWGIKTLGWWGMTETITHGIVGSFDFDDAAGSMGRPANEYRIRVVTLDGDDVAFGETGRLLIKGIPGVKLFLEYLHDPVASRDSFDSDGWFKTGDMVTLNADGTISFSEREKDVLKVGGENVSASEIERVILEVPGVSEVAVVSRADDFLEEVPIAYVVSGADQSVLAADVLEKCQDMLADFKRPRDVFVVDDLPRSLLNKIDKKTLRQMAADGKNQGNAQ